MLQNKIFIISICLVCFAGIELHSQSEDQFLPSEIKHHTIVTEPVSLNKGFFRAGMAGTYIVGDKFFDDQRKKNYASESTWFKTWQFNIVAQYGITDRLQVDLLVPYIHKALFYSYVNIFPAQNREEDKTWKLKGVGLGDISLYVRYQLITEANIRPSLVAYLGSVIPTGRKNPTEINDEYDYKLPTGDGEFEFNFRILSRKILYPFSLEAYSFYSYSLKGSKLLYSVDSEETGFRSGSRLQVGGRANMLLNDWLAIGNEINYSYIGKGQRDHSAEGMLTHSWAISYEARLIFQIKQFRIAESIDLPLTGRSISADPSYILVVQFVF